MTFEAHVRDDLIVSKRMFNIAEYCKVYSIHLYMVFVLWYWITLHFVPVPYLSSRRNKPSKNWILDFLNIHYMKEHAKNKNAILCKNTIITLFQFKLNFVILHRYSIWNDNFLKIILTCELYLVYTQIFK